jgi:hypothetical protein
LTTIANADIYNGMETEKKKKTTNLEQFNVLMLPGTRKRLLAIGHTLGCVKSAEVMRIAIKQFIDRHEGEAQGGKAVKEEQPAA